MYLGPLEVLSMYGNELARALGKMCCLDMSKTKRCISCMCMSNLISQVGMVGGQAALVYRGLNLDLATAWRVYLVELTRIVVLDGPQALHDLHT